MFLRHKITVRFIVQTAQLQSQIFETTTRVVHLCLETRVGIRHANHLTLESVHARQDVSDLLCVHRLGQCVCIRVCVHYCGPIFFLHQVAKRLVCLLYAPPRRLRPGYISIRSLMTFLFVLSDRMKFQIFDIQFHLQHP